MFWKTLNPTPIATNMTLGMVAGIETIVICLSYATLIFSGALQTNFLTGVCLLLISAAILLTVHALLSVFPTAEAPPQKQPLAIIALIGTSLAGMHLGAQLFSTLWAVIVMATLVTAAAALLMGTFKLGNLIRYIPYPVTAGFLAGTGLITIKVTFSMLAKTPLNWQNAKQFFTPHAIELWLPALALALIILALKRNRYQKSTLIPLLLFSATAIFYLVMWGMHIPFKEVAQADFLLGPFSANRLWSPPALGTMTQINWHAALSQSGKILIIALVGLLDCLLHLSIIELVTQREMKINRELKVFGGANLLSGLLGGFLGSLVPNTGAFQREGGTSRIIGLFAALSCVLVLFVGTSAITWIPRYVLGGLLLYFGLFTLSNTLYQGWKTLSLLDYLTLISIILVIGFFGLIEGAILGVILSMILFVIKYSRIGIIKYALTGHTLKSTLQRPPREQKILTAQANQILYLKLHGYIFFGTANSLFDDINQRLKNQRAFQYLILDFSAVDGLDSSATLYIAKLERLAQQHPFTLVLAAPNNEIQQSLQQATQPDQTEADTHIFSDIDEAIEWCEDTILAGHPELSTAHRALIERLQELLPDREQAEALLKTFERIQVPAGKLLCQQGEPAETLYFIESGLVSIFIENAQGEKTRLRKIGPNNIIGEMGLYNHAPRSASVIAETDSILHVLSLETLENLETSNPMLAAHFHRLIIHILIERLSFRNQQVSALTE